MKILVIGSGGREHALCWKIAQSKRVSKIYCAPGNGGIGEIAENINIKVDEIDKLLEFAINKNIDLTVVGPELPLVMGIVDIFQENGLKIFGVNKRSAYLEGSKNYSKEFMYKYKIPTAKYKRFTKLDEALEGIKSFDYPLVIKADGLCAGKGVVICTDELHAIHTLKDILENKIFGDEGLQVVVEEFLDGIESSLLCWVTEDKIIPMESAKDYKKIYDNDQGPNTGGVGCYSPSPLFTEDFKLKIEKNILRPIIKGLNEENLDFKGILFIGLMIINGEPKVLEFNTRFGDPETEVLMPRLETDILDVFEKIIDGSLEESDIQWKKEKSMTVILTSEGYPNKYKKGFLIEGLEKLDKGIILFHNGTKRNNKSLLTDGGRVLAVTAIDNSMEVLRENIYKNIHKIEYSGINFRKDIGK